MTLSVALAVALAALVALALEAWLARRSLAWLDRAGEGEARARAEERTRLTAAAVTGRALLALAASAGGAELLVAALGPSGAALAAVLLVLAVEPVLAVRARLAWESRGGLGRQMRLFGRSLLLMAPAALAAGWAATAAGPRWWWLPAWLAWLAVVAGREMLAPGGLARSPLAAAPHLDEVLRRSGVTGVEVLVEGPSAQANARAEGIGRHRRLVLTDRLLQQLSPDQAAAVLGHELGHLKGRHREVYAAWQAGSGLALLLAAHALAAHAQVGHAQVGGGLCLLILAAPVAAFLMRPLETALIRRFEWAADAMAVELAGAASLASALEVLFAANATLAAYEPVHGAFHSPHPAPAERLKRILARD